MKWFNTKNGDILLADGNILVLYRKKCKPRVLELKTKREAVDFAKYYVKETDKYFELIKKKKKRKRKKIIFKLPYNYAYRIPPDPKSPAIRNKQRWRDIKDIQQERNTPVSIKQ